MNRLWCALRRHPATWSTTENGPHRVIRVRECPCGRVREDRVWSRWMWDLNQQMHQRVIDSLSFSWDAPTIKAKYIDHSERRQK